MFVGAILFGAVAMVLWCCGAVRCCGAVVLRTAVAVNLFGVYSEMQHKILNTHCFFFLTPPRGDWI